MYPPQPPPPTTNTYAYSGASSVFMPYPVNQVRHEFPNNPVPSFPMYPTAAYPAFTPWNGMNYAYQTPQFGFYVPLEPVEPTDLSIPKIPQPEQRVEVSKNNENEQKIVEKPAEMPAEERSDVSVPAKIEENRENVDTSGLSNASDVSDGDSAHAQKKFKGKMKNRRSRTSFTMEQMKKLESAFKVEMYLVGEERRKFASSIDLTDTQVKVWFQNRRIKWRKEKAEEQRLQQDKGSELVESKKDE